MTNRISNLPGKLLAGLYGSVVGLRSKAYDRGVLKINRFELPVISVGNLTVGGTGKTPMVLFLAEFLKSIQVRPCIVSRGYGRLSNGYVLVHNGESLQCSVQDAGDEPWLMASRLRNVPVAVCADRSRGIARLLHSCNVDVILLDDAYQHRRAWRDLNILLFNSQTPREHYKLLPLGRLREPLTEVRRADLVIFTKNDNPDVPEFAGEMAETTSAPVISSGLRFQLMSAESDGLKPTNNLPEGCLAFCGIAEPASFKKSLEDMGIDIWWFKGFRDHTNYLETSVKNLRRIIENHGCPPVITTAKDLVKLPDDFIADFDMHVLDLMVTYSDKHLEILSEKIQETVSCGN